jgi:hypothetical protein
LHIQLLTENVRYEYILLMRLRLQGKEGVVVVMTQQAILITHYPDHVQPGQATNTVEQLGDYLVGVGY